MTGATIPVSSICYTVVRGHARVVISPDTRACGYFVAVWGLTVADKTYSASALAQMACRLGFSPLYLRLPRFFRDLAVAKGDGRYGRLLRSLAKTELVVLDDWGLAPCLYDHAQRRIDAQTVTQIEQKSATEDRSLKLCVAGLQGVAGFARNRWPTSSEYARHNYMASSKGARAFP